jgi:hypothetical protein
MLDVTPGAHIHTSICKKNFFSFPVAVNSSIKVLPLVFLLQMFVIAGNIMKCPVYCRVTSPAVPEPTVVRQLHCCCLY